MKRSLILFVSAWLAYPDVSVVAAMEAAEAVDDMEVMADGSLVDTHITNGMRPTNNHNHTQSLIHWIHAHGGHVHEHVRLDVKRGGVFASNSLPTNDSVLRIPTSLVLLVKNTMDCDAVRQWQQDLDNPTSFHAPFVNYMREQHQSTTPRTAPPMDVWRDAGKALLQKLLEASSNNYNDKNIWEPLKHCNLEHNEQSTAVILLAMQQQQQALQPAENNNEPTLQLVPVLDSIRRAQGHGVNVNVVWNHDYSSLEVQTTRPVSAGEELWRADTSASNDDDTTDRFLRLGTLDESYPRRWTFDGTSLAFEINVADNDTDDDDTDDDDSQTYTVRWLENAPTNKDIRWATNTLNELEVFRNEHLEAFVDPSIPDHELETINTYFQALTAALETAVEYSRDETICVYAHGSCPNDPHEYDALDIQPMPTENTVHVNLCPNGHYSCDATITHAFTDYVSIDTIHSHYQNLEFYWHPTTRDTCFTLDGIVQQCSSYIPHYHEAEVHYTARYLNEINRVAFIGAGDSMLLQEILLYPTLEKVVGLELDQKVTRYNYKHFGTSPHWDNDKVEWWYGDATKSLMMLPKDYFGSFDMVLIDLSDTVMDMSVTKDLDIFGALSRLLKTDGILVKNERYLEQMSRVFDHTVQMHFYDVPVVCSQSFVLGSYNVDFLTREPKSHGIETKFLSKRPDITSRFGAWHDYRRNITRPDTHCKVNGAAEPEPESQSSSPGILMILEVEDITIELASTDTVVSVVSKAMETAGLSGTSSFVPFDNSRMFTVVADQGFVAVRTWPEDKYCAFDIHLWGSFEKHDVVKNALIHAMASGIDSKATSSYRIVVGGIFGIDIWKTDEKNRGPRATNECKIKNDTHRETPMEQAKVDAVLVETLDLIERDALTVAVFCGVQTEACESLGALQNSAKVSKVIPVFTCFGLAVGSNKTTGSNTAKALMDCQKNTLQVLTSLAGQDDTDIDVLAIDPDAPFAQGQILHKLLFEEMLDDFLANDYMVVAHSNDLSETWRRAFLDRVRRDIVRDDPVFRGEVLLNKTYATMEMGFTSSGDTALPQRLMAWIDRIEKKHGLVPELRNMQGANFTYQHNFQPGEFYQLDDYNRSDALEQWKSQKPLSFQTILQLDLRRIKDFVMEDDLVKVKYEEAYYEAVVTEVHPDGKIDVEYIVDGSPQEGVSPFEYRRIIDNEKVEAERLAKLRAINVSLSAAQVKRAIEFAIADADEVAYVETRQVKLGEGQLLLYYWDAGSVFVLWDGRDHVDINLFTYEEDDYFVDEFLENINTQIPRLYLSLRDEQPRGLGRVVTYKRDLLEFRGKPPRWANEITGR
jgi:spermidine synthase